MMLMGTSASALLLGMVTRLSPVHHGRNRVLRAARGPHTRGPGVRERRRASVGSTTAVAAEYLEELVFGRELDGSVLTRRPAPSLLDARGSSRKQVEEKAACTG